MRPSGRLVYVFGLLLVAGSVCDSVALASSNVVAWGGHGTEVPYTGQCDVPDMAFTAVAGGLGHSLGIRTDGTLAAWGSNYYGECNVPSGTFMAIAAGAAYSLALRADGTLVGWGDDSYGQLNVPGGTFSAVAAGYHHGLAIAIPEPSSLAALALGLVSVGVRAARRKRR